MSLSTGTPARSPLRKWALGVMLVGAVSAMTACTSSSHKDASGPSGPGSSAAGSAAPTENPPFTGPKPASTPVKPPTPGDVHHTVPVQPASAKPAVALTSAGDFGGRVIVHVTDMKSATAHARGPGEVTGPGLVLTLQIDNGSKKSIDLGNVVVALTDSTKAPANPMAASPARPFSGQLAAGKQASGVYVFTIPKANRHPISVAVSYTTNAPVVVFTGDAP
jgi:hypothetical protein